MIKLYQRDPQGGLHYHEVWVSAEQLIEHWGPIGSRGESRAHAMDGAIGAQVERILGPARAAGFAPIADADHVVVLVEYAVGAAGETRDANKRAAVQDALDAILGWTGLGHCDGGSLGSGTLEVCCYVVDAALAKAVLARELAATDFADFTRIYAEDEDA